MVARCDEIDLFTINNFRSQTCSNMDSDYLLVVQAMSSTLSILISIICSSPMLANIVCCGTRLSAFTAICQTGANGGNAPASISTESSRPSMNQPVFVQLKCIEALTQGGQLLKQERSRNLWNQKCRTFPKISEAVNTQ